MPVYIDGRLLIDAQLAMLGNVEGGNYAGFESDGTLVLYGDARTWRDEYGQLLTGRVESPASDIVQDLTEVSLTFKASAVYPTDFVSYNLQMNHDWVTAGEMDFHIHWWQASAAVPNWLIAYRWQVNGQAKETSWTLKIYSENVFTYSAGTLVQITDFGALTVPETVALSDILQVKLFRDYTNVSTLFSGAESSGLAVDALFSDVHRQSDTIMGSREEYVK